MSTHSPTTSSAPFDPLSERPLRPSEAVRMLMEDLEEYAVLILHRNGRILANSFGTERLLGWKRGELNGHPFSVLFQPQDREIGERALTRARDEGRVHEVWCHVRPDGGRVLADAVIRPLFREGGLVGFGVILREVTEERAAETIRRSERHYRELAEELEKLHRQKDAFFATVSHELRNPLAAMMNALEIIRMERVTTPMQVRAREIIDRQARHLIDLIDDLLDASRLAAGKMLLRKQQVDARVAVERAVETCRPLLDTRRHVFRLELPDQPLWLQADPARLEQIVVNLLNNAAKYTAEGGTIEVRLAEEDRHAVVRVRDNGMGIAPELISKIFELFAQADQGNQGGLGIGLAVVHSLVALHHGTVEARSAGTGQGSEFVVRLPLGTG